jgi:hypothetical protein
MHVKCIFCFDSAKSPDCGHFVAAHVTSLRSRVGGLQINLLQVALLEKTRCQTVSVVLCWSNPVRVRDQPRSPSCTTTGTTSWILIRRPYARMAGREVVDRLITPFSRDSSEPNYVQRALLWRLQITSGRFSMTARRSLFATTSSILVYVFAGHKARTTHGPSRISVRHCRSSALPRYPCRYIASLWSQH